MSTLGRCRAFFEEALVPLADRSADADQWLRLRVLVVYIGCTLLLTLSWGSIHLSFGSPWTALMFGVLALGAVAVLLRLARDRQAQRAGHRILALAVVGVSLATAFTGGLRLTNVAPYFITIVAPFFLLGRPGLPWAVASVALPLAYELAARAGVVFPDVVPADERAADAFLTWLSSAASVFLFAWFYEQARVLALRRLESASAAKSQFLANISHELRTPLHAMVASSALLEESVLDGEQRALVQQARQQGRHLGELIDDLLDLSALQTGHFTIRPADFSPGEVLREVTTVLAPRCQAKQLALHCEVAAELPARVHGDATRLLQILNNLGSNAVKFTARGQVVLRAEPAPCPDAPHACRFTVRDTGIGIAEADQQRIFESFVQLDGSLARAHEGAGLGLHIARQLTLRMGGTLRVESAPGQGSAFVLELPFAAPQLAASEGEIRVVPLRVLLVEDNAINQELARHMLSRLGHQVLLANSGDEGVRCCQRERPDVVLMDIQMPGMDGLAAMRAIRSDERARGATAVPLVAMSGHHAPQDLATYRELGVARALVRPFTRDELAEALRQTCGQRPPRHLEAADLAPSVVTPARAGGASEASPPLHPPPR